MRGAALAFVLLTAISTPAAAASQRPLIVTSADHSLKEGDDCEHFHTQNTTSFPKQARQEEQRDVALSGIDLVKVRASEEGGVSVRGWDKPTARLTICKYAMALTEVAAQRALSSVTVSVHNGEIVSAGPEIGESQVWWVHMILRVPKTSNVDVASANGGIAIRNMSGKVTAQSTNGGISIAQLDGESRVSTANGGISIEKISGRLEANTQNGPISLKLRDSSIPALEARTDEQGEILCKKCSTATWAANKKYLRLGGGSQPSIKLFTNSAMIVIEQVR
ncbi:MAG: DUF4097 family beta strand repeat protein [Acidobacteria bacterium]|nr:DUF4097 family beta strand repeat protein [Acidobacteriota bacterium]